MKKDQTYLEILYNIFFFLILISTKHQQINFLPLKQVSVSDVLADGLWNKTDRQSIKCFFSLSEATVKCHQNAQIFTTFSAQTWPINSKTKANRTEASTFLKDHQDVYLVIYLGEVMHFTWENTGITYMSVN